MRRKQSMEKRLASLAERKVELGKIADGPVGDKTDTQRGDFAQQSADNLHSHEDAAIKEHARRSHERIAVGQLRCREGLLGICSECGTSIPLTRMQAMPEADTCIKCQKQREEEAKLL